jgi:hypothetical protein
MLKLDLRRPILVIAGAWNPAIFHPVWVARHLLGYPEGDTIRATLVQTGPPLHTTTYLDGIGYSASAQRFELALAHQDPEGFARAARCVQNLVGTLPHTPVNACGINFNFVDDDPGPEVLDLLVSNDGIDQHFVITTQEFLATINLEDGCELHFKRIPTPEQVAFDFNYHYSLQNLEPLQGIDAAKFATLLHKSYDSLKNIYGYRGNYGLVENEIPNGEGGGEHT